MARLDDEYRRLFRRQPEGWALYKNVPSRSMKPGLFGYFDHLGDWYTCLDSSNININYFTDKGLTEPTPRMLINQSSANTIWGWKVSNQRTGVKSEIAASAGVPATGRISFHTTSHASAVCVTEPISTLTLETRHTILPWIKQNAARLLEIYRDFINNERGLWLVTKTYTTTCAAVGILERESNGFLVGVSANSRNVGNVRLMNSSWEGHITGASAINFSPDFTNVDENIVVFMAGLRLVEVRWWHKIIGEDPSEVRLRGGGSPEQRGSYELTEQISTHVLLSECQDGRTYELTFEAYGMNDDDLSEIGLGPAQSGVRSNKQIPPPNDQESLLEAENMPSRSFPREPKANAKRALLIGSSYGGLLGTENDVDTMINVLKSRGFDVENDDYVKRLCGEDATRQKILDTWEDLVSHSSSGDTVIIYYSGHGGLADSEKANEKPEHPSRIQFIVPYDFDPTLEEWRGILDSELSQLLLETTKRTENVTFILDCCHSARAVRDLEAEAGLPQDETRRIKLVHLPRDLHSKLSKLLEQRGPAGILQENHLWTNPYAVRIAAAAADEAAWEYHKPGVGHVGILTEKLAILMDGAGGQMSWRNIMLGVRGLVERQFLQHPRSAGPDARIPFSMNMSTPNALLAEIGDNGNATIQGGKLDGVREGDVYAITPLGSEGPIATATVTRVYILTAVANPTLPIQRSSFPLNLALAVPCRHFRWPAAFPEDAHDIQAQLDTSDFLKKGENPLVTFQRGGDNNENMVLYNNRGVELGSIQVNDGSISQQAIKELFSAAEKFAQAQHILRLEPGSGRESLDADVEIELSRVQDENEDVLLRYSAKSTVEHPTIDLVENESICIWVKNKSGSKVYVSVFNVEANGDTNLVSKAWEKGIELGSGRGQLLALRHEPLKGLPLKWPKSVPRRGCVEETLVCVITTEEVDLRAFDNLSPEDDAAQQRGDEPPKASRRSTVAYNVTHLRYFLRSSTVSEGAH